MRPTKPTLLTIATFLFGLSVPIPAPAADVVAANTEFAFDLYHQLSPADGNLLFSPYSISQALAMTYAGARNATEQQMAAVLHFGPSKAGVPLEFKKLDNDLHSVSKTRHGDRAFELHIANALWGQRGYDFLKNFLVVVEANYRAPLRLVDFQRDPEAARKEINQWVEQQTQDKIKDLLASGMVTPDTRLVLTNAIYFNAAWQNPFLPRATRDQDFHLLDGSTASVPMMSQVERLRYASADGLEALEIPYVGRRLAMIVLLPESGEFQKTQKSLNRKGLDDLLGKLAIEEVDLTMPRFKYESQFSLAGELTKMGMTDAFNAARADFSGMNGRRDLYIDFVIHKAFIRVDEEGTEAAAATAVGVKATAIMKPKTPIPLRIDRPFIYLIRDAKTGAILFLGRVLDPR